MTIEGKTLTVNDLMSRWRPVAFRVGRRVFSVALDEVIRFEKAGAA
ncbi:MAG TPA: hypothetical protein VGL61_25735 [Kofleriaceae bacterium]|jgi:hypothetical protein